MIKITNDKKEESQSWEASEDNDSGDANGYYSYTLNGYGGNEIECRKNFNRAIDALFQNLKRIKSENNKGIY